MRVVIIIFSKKKYYGIVDVKKTKFMDNIFPLLSPHIPLPFELALALLSPATIVLCSL